MITRPLTPLQQGEVRRISHFTIEASAQNLAEPGFYSYDVRVDAPGDPLPQYNRATGFTIVRGEPRILVVSADPDEDRQLAAALKSSRLEVGLVGLAGFPATLAEMQSYDSIFINNIAAGDLGLDRQRLLESAVRDFGVGLVCVGGDQTYTATAIGTPTLLAPVDTTVWWYIPPTKVTFSWTQVTAGTDSIRYDVVIRRGDGSIYKQLVQYAPPVPASSPLR